MENKISKKIEKYQMKYNLEKDTSKKKIYSLKLQYYKSTQQNGGTNNNKTIEITKSENVDDIIREEIERLSNINNKNKRKVQNLVLTSSEENN
jgi:hypothetical protein